ncbi:aminoacyltransferase [Flavobacterium sp. ZT3R18]|uniref:aminoacyltransferase n=1 Tax=Flavobacterium sp. ZT3R18 TaxID=2594429 RepID=UPI00117A02D8|nr:aminoacyltransferase [Flavobacterium sp. ZT3R18]TRX35856.1 aminoacyltransferase [Flavobacterium sp. ZT3R18]
MIETEITILINRKSDADLIKQKIIDSKIQFPIYILEYENHYRLNFISDYEEWELDSKILDCFSEYEFTSELERGKKEIRLQLSRYQSEFSTDGWGRPIENPLNETKYLIKKSNNKPEKFNPQIKVLFEGNEQHYFVNIVDGINKTSEEKGFLLLNEFKNENYEADILNDKLYKTPFEAFQLGCYKMQDVVNQDFKDYIECKKKELRELQKIPRKIVRDFINSCNKSENEGIFKNIDKDIIFERRINWQTKLRIEGIQEFKEYIKSPNQELCARNLKIRSSWNINLPNITIGVKFSPNTTNNEKEIGNIQEYRQINFLLKDNKINRITKEN